MFLLGVVGLPWAKYVFATLPAAMLGMARLLGVALVGVLAWSVAMLGILPFSGGTVLVSMLIIAGLGWRLCGGIDRAWLKAHWRALAVSEVMFVFGFAMVVYIRGHNPDPWGTERPMDFAFLQSVLQSPSFPPLDPWMAGFPINYYYFGYVLAAIPVTLTVADPAVAYNLALATSAGLAAVAIAAVVVSMVRLLVAERWHGPDWAVAVSAVVVVLVAGNLGGFVQVVAGFPEVLALQGRDVGRALINGVTTRTPLELSQPFRGWDFDGMTTATPRDMWAEFNWWNPSRAVWDDIPIDAGRTERRYAITEFPFFSYWLGDMHPHVMALPYGVLLVAFALRRASLPAVPWVLPALLIGMLYPLNSWDYPTYLFLYVAAIVWSSVRHGRGWRALLQESVLVVVASYLWYLPFHGSFYSLVGSLEPLTTIPLLATVSRYFGVAPAQTEFHGLVVMFGLFLTPIFLMAWQLCDTPIERRLYGVTGIVAVVGAFGGFATVFALPLAALLLHIAFRRATVTPAQTLWLGMAALAALLLVAVDVVFIRDVFSSRMNTVFKFYYQVWVLWGMVAVVATWWLWSVASSRMRWVLLGVVLPILGAALVYPAATLGGVPGSGSSWSLAGRTPRDWAPGGSASVAWLRANAPAGAVVLEAVGGSYDIEGRGYGAISAATGRPTVMGWPGHESQWRGGHPEANAQIGQREQDVAIMYTSGDAATVTQLLQQYRVRYIYVGPTERATYGEAGLALFAEVADEVFREGDVVIYQVRS
jgi:YYY domain-containing protein